MSVPSKAPIARNPFASSAERDRPSWRGTAPFVATATPTAVHAFGAERADDTEMADTVALASIMSAVLPTIRAVAATGAPAYVVA